MIYEKLKIRDISKRLKNSDAVISAYIPANSKEINLNKKSWQPAFNLSFQRLRI